MSFSNVLVVDDDIAICRILQRMLSEEQYKVETSQSVADAVRAIEEKAFDLYVMDYKLPDGSGLDVAARVRSKWGAAPIILISGYDPSAIALRAGELDISEFLEKPFSREIILSAVKRAMSSGPISVALKDPKIEDPRANSGKSPFHKIFSAIGRLGKLGQN
jgi:two-component system, NtrC family, response regulator HydG